MVALRSGPKGGSFTLFGLILPVSILLPTSIGYQDLASLIAQQPAVSARWRQHMIASPFGTIHAATFSFPRPIGTSIPEPENYRLASFDPSDPELTGAFDRSARGYGDSASEPLIFPTVDRSKKGDFLGSRPESAPVMPQAQADEPRDETVAPDIAKEASAPLPAGRPVDEIEAAVRFEPFPQYDISMSLEDHPQIPVEPVDPANPEGGQPDISLIAMANDADPTERMARLFFGGSLNTFSPAIEPWTAGEEPVVMMPRAPGDPDIRNAALAPNQDAAISGDGKGNGPGGVTLAPKGEVAADVRQPKSPAERLNLAGKSRAKAEKCLANAVYFESRNEPVRGQIGVAQVVMNRVFSGFYPNDVCNVVYQNAHRHLACQFTFACDGIPDVVNDEESWARAKRVANAVLDGKVWLPQIGKATHYHANYVHPYWVRSMRKMSRIGAHIFYRPRQWGDGADAPAWGTTTAAADL